MTVTVPPQLEDLTQAAKKLASEGLYLGVGFGVLAAREINMRRDDIASVVNEVQQMLPPALRTTPEQLSEFAAQLSEMAAQLVKVGESAGREVLHRMNRA